MYSVALTTEKQLLFYIPVAYSIPCYAFYIFTIYVLSMRSFKNYFDSTFFTLFKVQGVIDMLVHVLNWLTLRIPFSGLFNEFFGEPAIERGFFPTFLVFLYYYATYAQIFNLTLVTLNRLVIIALPGYFRILWITYLKYVVAITHILPSALTWHVLAGGAYFRFMPGQGWASTNNKFLGIRNSLYVLIVILITSALNLVVNMTTVFFIVSKKKCRKNWSEIKLFFLTVSMFLIHLMEAILQIYAYQSGSDWAVMKVVFILTSFVKDLTCLTAPWFLFITSRTCRRAMCQVVRWTKTNGTDSSLFAKRS
uniref:Serpentine receptor class gamma n=1 Tax=Steinernema glaseri TaxID=37863 RepID=A0A1I7Z8A3_9BILA